MKTPTAFTFAVLFLAACGGAPLDELTDTSESAITEAASSYQMGDEWGKQAVTAASLATATPAYKRAAMATAKFGGATAFYLGKFNGWHVMATNHHVLPSTSYCSGRSARFPHLANLSFSCAKAFGTWSDIDLALFAIRVTRAADEQRLAGVAANFDWDQALTPGATLATIGFGNSQNPTGAMMGNKDADCRVMSQTGDFRFLADPDTVNPGGYKAWSFAHACDVSHGDSGSAMVDRTTGKPVGILWTGKIPKPARVQSSAYLDTLLQTNGPDVWTELSYAVPAAKMAERLTAVAAARTTSADTRATLTALLAR